MMSEKSYDQFELLYLMCDLKTQIAQIKSLLKAKLNLIECLCWVIGEYTM